MIDRLLENQILRRMEDGKVLLLFGGRQVGKTTIIRKLFTKKEGVLWLNGNEPETRDLFGKSDSLSYRNTLKHHSLVIIDEAQDIHHIGEKLKLLHDTVPSVKLIVTGSSDIRLADLTVEALAGRKWEFYLNTLSFEELFLLYGREEEKQLLSHRLLYGSYPEVITCSSGDEAQLLIQISSSVLCEELLHPESRMEGSKICRLLLLLAYSPGHEYSSHELSEKSGLNEQKVEEYLLLFEKSHLIFTLNSYPGQLWNEKKDGKRCYFTDTGLRNAILLDFSDISSRKDIESLWKNYLIAERKKYLMHHGNLTNTYYWKTHYHQEISYIENRSGQLHAYEFSWNREAKSAPLRAFRLGYPEATTTMVTLDNYDAFLLGEI